LFFVQAWEDRARPVPFNFVELGPGRGTLMADMIRAAAKLRPRFAEAARIVLVETSPALRRAQEAALASSSVRWVSRFEDVPTEGPLFLVANEFFDALPIRQFVKSERGWHERMVTSDGAALRFMLTPDIVPASVIPAPLRDTPAGSVVELNANATALAETIAGRIADAGSVALIIDYGDADTTAGDTFQAMKNNAFADSLAEPGEADLTAHVDFGALAAAARDGRGHVTKISTQGRLLESLGIRTRVNRLKHQTPETASEIQTAVDRLTNPEQMGTLFKALAIFEGQNHPTPPGFDV
jgi:NADH dehydrogenase [ubiquinone] 1 alpha subcomplex assembly factor 7